MGPDAAVQTPLPAAAPSPRTVAEATDLIEWYYEQGWSDGFPLVPPTPEKIAAVVSALGVEAGRFSAFIPGWGHMSSPVLRGLEGEPAAAGPQCVDGTCAL